MGNIIDFQKAKQKKYKEAEKVYDELLHTIKDYIINNLSVAEDDDIEYITITVPVTKQYLQYMIKPKNGQYVLYKKDGKFAERMYNNKKYEKIQEQLFTDIFNTILNSLLKIKG